MPNPHKGSGRLGKAKCRTPSANVAEESDLGIALMNQPNKVELQAKAEAGEEAKGQGELFIVQHVPDTERVEHVPGTVESTGSGETEQENPLQCSASLRHNFIPSAM